jgi:hypothetical protein
MRVALTTPDGRQFEVDPDKIDILEEAQPHMFAPGVASVVYVGGHMQAVKETVAQIRALESKKS